VSLRGWMERGYVMNEQVLRALRMAKLALEDTHGRCAHDRNLLKHHFQVDNSAIIKEVALAIEVFKDSEHIADEVSGLLARMEKAVDALLHPPLISREEAIGHLKALGFGRKEAEKELDSERFEGFTARLRTELAQADKERHRDYARRMEAPMLCSVTYINGMGCLQDAKFVVSGPCEYASYPGKQYACGCHLMQTIEEMMENQEGIAHVEAV